MCKKLNELKITIFVQNDNEVFKYRGSNVRRIRLHCHSRLLGHPMKYDARY